MEVEGKQILSANEMWENAASEPGICTNTHAQYIVPVWTKCKQQQNGIKKI